MKLLVLVLSLVFNYSTLCPSFTLHAHLETHSKPTLQEIFRQFQHNSMNTINQIKNHYPELYTASLITGGAFVVTAISIKIAQLSYALASARLDSLSAQKFKHSYDQLIIIQYTLGKALQEQQKEDIFKTIVHLEDILVSLAPSCYSSLSSWPVLGWCASKTSKQYLQLGQEIEHFLVDSSEISAHAVYTTLCKFTQLLWVSRKC